MLHCLYALYLIQLYNSVTRYIAAKLFSIVALPRTPGTPVPEKKNVKFYIHEYLKFIRTKINLEKNSLNRAVHAQL